MILYKERKITFFITAFIDKYVFTYESNNKSRKNILILILTLNILEILHIILFIYLFI